jgi:cell division protein FtsW
MNIFRLKDQLQGDRQIWTIAFLLCLVSAVSVYSSIAALAARSAYASPEMIAIQHIAFLFLGLLVIYFVHRFNFLKVAPIAKLLLYITPFLLLYTLLMGKEVGAAKRWISILGFTFQTSDLVRLVLITNLAAMLGSKQNTSIEWKDFRSIILWCGGLCGMLAVSSFSTSVILGVTCCLIMWIGRVPRKFLWGLIGSVILGLILSVGTGLIMKSFGKEFGRTQVIIDRVEVFVEKDLDNSGLIGGSVGSESTQKEEALLAIARGGLIGEGPGNSVVKYRLAESYSDFIYSIILEEYGMLGGLLVMALYIWLLYRGIYLVEHSTRPFAGLLSIGITLSIVFQAFAHMFINVGLGPVTGQTLPMISKGGTSILFTAIALGIVLSVSKEEKKELSNRNR